MIATILSMAVASKDESRGVIDKPREAWKPVLVCCVDVLKGIQEIYNLCQDGESKLSASRRNTCAKFDSVRYGKASER